MLSLIISCVTAAAGASSFCDAADWKIVWSEEFDAPVLDESKWSVAEGRHTGMCRDATCSPSAVAVDGGKLILTSEERPHARADCHGAGCILLGSCRDAECTRDSVVVGDGKLRLHSDRRHANATNYTTGAVNTRGKVAWRANTAEGPFRLCISAVLPGVPGRAAGVWPAHWLMPADDSCDPDEGEMDIMEMIDGNGDSFSTYHWQTTFPKTNCSYPAGHEHVYAKATLPDGWEHTAHEWAVERGPSHVAFAVDGVVTLNSTASSAAKPLFWDVPWYLILNTAIGGGWPGPPTPDTAFPIRHEIDYVRAARRR